jgi:hypothetical protein
MQIVDVGARAGQLGPQARRAGPDLLGQLIELALDRVEPRQRVPAGGVG